MYICTSSQFAETLGGHNIEVPRQKYQIFCVEFCKEAPPYFFFQVIPCYTAQTPVNYVLFAQDNCRADFAIGVS